MFCFLLSCFSRFSESSPLSSASPSSSSSSSSPKAATWKWRIERKIPALFAFFGHQLRSAITQAAQAGYIDQLIVKQVFILADFMCKLLEADGRLKQEDWFGRAGNSYFGSCAITRSEDGGYIISYFDILFQERPS